MITEFKSFWAPYLKDIDVKSYEYPWLDEWGQLNRYVIRGAIRQDGKDFRVVAFYAVKPGVVCTIHKLAVRPHFRGQGIGKELLADLEKSCKEWGVSMEALLHEENVYGLNWARRQGFTAIGIKPRYFPDERDGIVLRKEL
jgi:ribosomal protein S18 acetylase RimI-like enzyme